MGFFDHHPAGSQNIDTTATIRRFSRLTQRVVHCGRLIGVRDAGFDPVGQHRGADNAASVVENLNQVIGFDAPLRSILGIDPDDVDSSMESDVVAEMLNTMAGAWMRKITEVSQPYELGLPDTADADYIDSKAAEIHCVFSADDDFIEVSFFLID